MFGEATTGPSNDIQKVTQIARSMVTRWGMSERLGPRTFGKSEEMVFLGREISETRDYSEKVAEAIDDEVRRIIDEAHVRAMELLIEHRAVLDKLANVLLEVETLEGERLIKLLDSDPDEPWPPPGEESPTAPPPAATPSEEPEDRPSFEPTPEAWPCLGGREPDEHRRRQRPVTPGN